MKNKTSIIILTYNHLNYTKDCIESIWKYTKKGTYEIIVIDNLSVDGTREWLKKQKDIKVLFNEENVGFPKGCNQGIELADSKNDILLLNNDTIVTENWLENLQICLYSDSKIGAVGSICNHDENLQGCDFSYDDFDMMQQLAKENNISNPEKWEEKNFLIGFCLLIKREVINKIHLLDEEYSPGYIEDNDLSLRILKEGYQLMLCHDSFIHHYLGTAFRKDLTKFYPVLYKNRDYFQKKWKFDTYSFDDIKNASIKLLEQPIKILELNCGIGSTILKIKYLFKNTIIYGVEEDDNKRSISNNFTKIYSSIHQVVDNDFDYILIGDVLESVTDPVSFLKKIDCYLKEGGYIIGEIHNVASIENILSLLKGNWYFYHSKLKNYFTIMDIQELFANQHYKNEFIFSWYKSVNGEEKGVIELLSQKYPEKYEVTYYSFRYQK